MITALAGGVGAARFLTGLVKLVDGNDLSIIVNTGDDIELFGLHISPDVNIATYTLAGIVDEAKGWGIKEDTFHCLDALRKFNGEVRFNLGDKDLATHMFRTALIKNGFKLSDITVRISRALGLDVTILPMTDDKFEARIVTGQSSVHFQEYLVKRGAKDSVLNGISRRRKCKPCGGRGGIHQGGVVSDNLPEQSNSKHRYDSRCELSSRRY